jgi:Hypoxia induced protein conserved region
MVGHILIILALVTVAAILIAGLVVMAIGGEVAGKWSNKLMRYRVLAQGIAVLVLLLILYFSSPH